MINLGYTQAAAKPAHIWYALILPASVYIKQPFFGSNLEKLRLFTFAFLCASRFQEVLQLLAWHAAARPKLNV
jgi:hypothetical protein